MVSRPGVVHKPYPVHRAYTLNPKALNPKNPFKSLRGGLPGGRAALGCGRRA